MAWLEATSARTTIFSNWIYPDSISVGTTWKVILPQYMICPILRGVLVARTLVPFVIQCTTLLIVVVQMWKLSQLVVIVLVLGTPEMNNFLIPCLAQNVYTVLFVFRFALEGLAQLHCVFVSWFYKLFFISVYININKQTTATHKHMLLFGKNIPQLLGKQTNNRLQRVGKNVMRDVYFRW